MSAAARERLDPREVYRVFSEEDPTASLALDAKIQNGHVSWFDTARDRGHKIRTQRVEGDAMVFETERATYRFVPLTKELYDREIKAQVELSPEFASTDELRAFYLKNFLGLEA